MKHLICIAVVAAWSIACGCFSARADDLAQRVRSILSNRCFACHGPDPEERQGGFRLDVRESFVAEADSGEFPVVPGKSSSSELLRRLTTEDQDERMPPSSFGAALPVEDVDAIRQWIDRGAELPQHWAFVAPQRPALPPVDMLSPKSQAWAQHPVDRFVWVKQAEQQLQPSPQATKAELLRRLSLDLIGLPPTPDEVRRFEQDDSPEAYVRQVDRLLASPAFGEHWARKWLDLARYADSAGYADDPPRTIWAYRDWVISALNDNLTIDDFTIQQLAGDLLPNPSPQQLVATAFHRNTLTNNEGGTNDEEFRNVAIVDRVNTTMAVWMGVTMACAQCHTHKYDPFTQEEYFQLFAIFNQSQDEDRKDERPTLSLFTAEQRRSQQQWQQRRQQIDQRLGEITPSILAELEEWETGLRVPEWRFCRPLHFSSQGTRQAEFAGDGAIRVLPADDPAKTDTYTLQFELSGGVEQQPIQAVGLQTLPDANLPGAGAGFGGGNFVVTGARGRLRFPASQEVRARFVRVELPGKAKILSLAEVQAFSAGQNVAPQGSATQSSTDYQGDASRAIDGNVDGDYQKNSTTHTAKSDHPWWEVDLGSQKALERVVIWNRTGAGLPQRLDGAAVTLLDDKRQPVFQETIVKAPAEHREIQLEKSIPIEFIAAYADYAQPGFPADNVVDGDSKSGWAVGGRTDQGHRLTLIPKQPVSLSEPAILELELEHKSPHADHLLGQFRVEVSSTKSVADWERMGPQLHAIYRKSAQQRTAEEQAQWGEFFSRNIASSYDRLREELRNLEDKLAALRPATSVPIMREVDTDARRKTFVQIRGNYKSLGKEVEPGTPAIFHPLDHSTEVGGDARQATELPVNRMMLAKWLTDSQNPLTARVWINRLWESLFGIGIVRSSEEFGSQGDRPSHPELLDWLACELMATGWDSKRMLRLIVTSSTYRQTSQVSAALLAQDKDNIWLARGPRVRLSAEMVRDQALAAAGLLSTRMFGEPVRPPQPDMGLKAAFGGATDWKTSQGEDRYRRGVYTTWRRSNPYPSMATFDAPSREVCTLRRDTTNTPLQALVTLNDPGFFEAAQALARRVVLYQPEVDDELSRIVAAFEYCTSRQPTAREIRTLRSLLARAREQLHGDPQAAQMLATDPLGPLPEGADAVELAAFSTLCNVLLNLDEVLMKR